MTRAQEIFWTFKMCGTDKSSHGYAMVYDKVPVNIENILEIGVANGASIRAWTRLFPNATIYGLDVKQDNPFIHPRVRYITCDISNFTFDDGTLWPYEQTWFDLVVDDGSHQAQHAIAGWKAISHKCRGLYVIEDMDWGVAKEVVNEVRGGSSVTSLIQCGPGDGDTCIVASFGEVIHW